MFAFVAIFMGGWAKAVFLSLGSNLRSYSRLQARSLEVSER